MVCLLNVATGQLKQELKGHRGGLRSVVFSPDGKLLASASDDHTVRLWNLEDGSTIRELRGDPQFLPVTVSFSPDSRLLASGSLYVSGEYYNRIHIWKIKNGTLINELKTDVPPTWWGYSAATNSVAFSPDGKQLAFGYYNGDIRVWEAALINLFQLIYN